MADRRVDVPIRVLLETLNIERRLFGALEDLAPRLVDPSDRGRAWQIHQDLLGIVARDLNLKKGVSPELLVSATRGESRQGSR